MTEIIFIVVKPKKKAKTHDMTNLHSANAFGVKTRKKGIVQLIREKTDPVVHRQIRKLSSKMFMYLLKTAKDFIYIRKQTDKHIYSLFEQTKKNMKTQRHCLTGSNAKKKSQTKRQIRS